MRLKASSPHDESMVELLRESLYRALSPKGTPTLKTLLAILAGAGLCLAVTHDENREEVPA
jgi:DNA-binding phage protein